MSTVLARMGAGTEGSSLDAPFVKGTSSLLMELTDRRLDYSTKKKDK